MRKANYDIMVQTPQGIILRDLGPWDKYLTITNAAEEVVEELVSQGILKEGQKLLCHDSEGDLTELVHKDGKFVGFKAP
jgi:hypothetical protein